MRNKAKEIPKKICTKNFASQRKVNLTGLIRNNIDKKNVKKTQTSRLLFAGTSQKDIKRLASSRRRKKMKRKEGRNSVFKPIPVVKKYMRSLTSQGNLFMWSIKAAKTTTTTTTNIKTRLKVLTSRLDTR